MGTLPFRDSRGPQTRTMKHNDRVRTVSATTQRIPNFGKTLLPSTGAVTIVLDPPYPGERVVLVKTTTSTAVLTVTSPTTTVLFNTAGNTNLTFDALGELVELEGRTELIWDLLVNVGSVGTS